MVREGIKSTERAPEIKGNIVVERAKFLVNTNIQERAQIYESTISK